MLPLAVRTGLEPATPGVTGRYSNQLNYRTICSVLMRFCRTRMQRYSFFLNLQIFLAFFDEKCQKNWRRAILDPPPVVFRIRKTVKLNVFVGAYDHLTSITRFSSSTFSFVVLGILT